MQNKIMKTYKFEVLIKESEDEYWSQITTDGNSRCNILLKDLKDTIDLANWQNVEVKLVEILYNDNE